MPGPLSLTTAEIDLYSVRLCVQSGLAANGWTGTRSVPVRLANNGWPVAEEISVPSIYVALGPVEIAPWDLGSHGKSRVFDIHIIAKNDPMKIALAEEVTNLFRDGDVSILNFVTGNEVAPASVADFAVDAVGWQPIPMPAQATEADRWRARVRAEVRRDDA